MKFSYLKYIAVCGLLFISIFSYSQYQNNSTLVIKKNKVKSLIVWTDSLKNGCPIDLFEYDKNGNIIIYHFGITLDETSYRYDSKNRLTDIYNYWEEFDPILLIPIAILHFTMTKRANSNIHPHFIIMIHPQL